jgi:hypothetical protein
MVYRLLAWWFRRDLDRLRFPEQTAAGRALFEEVFGTVRDGGLLGFEGVTESQLLARARCLPWHLRPFFHEGHAIGHAGRVACSFGRRNPEASFATRENQCTRFLSYGYWAAIAERYPLPSWPVEGGIWTAEPGHARYRRLMLNGLGFGRALLAGAFDRVAFDRLAAGYGEADRRAMLHGVGRVLWFLNLGNPPALSQILAAQGDLAEPLAVGLGVAIAFTQATRLEAVRETLAALPADLAPALWSGAGIALRFHAVNDPDAEAVIETGLAEDFRPWYLAARAASLAPRAEHDSVDWYYHRLDPAPSPP